MTIFKQNPQSGSTYGLFSKATLAEKRRIARDMLRRYTGLAYNEYQPTIILTNFSYYLESFSKMANRAPITGQYMRCVSSPKHKVTLIDMRVGSPTAAVIIELLSTVNPKAVLLLGMCGGLHRSLKVGDFILPIAAIRDEGVTGHFMPPQVPALPTFQIQKFVGQSLVEAGSSYRTGVVHTTDLRFWEFNPHFKEVLRQERVIGIEMECATLFLVGFICKVPIGSLLLVSDLPLKKNGVKTFKSSQSVFKKYTDLHLQVGLASLKEIYDKGENIRHYLW